MLRSPAPPSPGSALFRRSKDSDSATDCFIIQDVFLVASTEVYALLGLTPKSSPFDSKDIPFSSDEVSYMDPLECL